jgi:hypothetical protein
MQKIIQLRRTIKGVRRWAGFKDCSPIHPEYWPRFTVPPLGALETSHPHSIAFINHVFNWLREFLWAVRTSENPNIARFSAPKGVFFIQKCRCFVTFHSLDQSIKWCVLSFAQNTSSSQGGLPRVGVRKSQQAVQSHSPPII